jgi:hypothetical protein
MVLGDGAHAHRLLTEALQLCPSDDVRERSVLWHGLAELLFARGEPDEALRIRRDELLPVFERLGEVRERAVTLGQVADILSRRGEPDEALRIRRDELLPVFERLGDVRSQAVALGKVADILAARSELNEALCNLRDEVLPPLRRLRDLASLTQVLLLLGLLSARLRQTDAAVEYLREAQAGAARLGDDQALQVARRLLEQFGVD